MKRFFKIFVWALLLVLTSCIKEPLDVVDDAFHCLKRGNYDDFVEYIHPSDYSRIVEDNGGPMGLDDKDRKKWVTEVVKNKMQAELQRVDGIKSYKVYRQTLYETMVESSVGIEIVYGDSDKVRIEVKMKKIDDDWYFIWN